jgi:predicted transcriptional regulator
MAKLNIEIPDSLHRALKRLAVDRSTSMRTILIELIAKFVSKEGGVTLHVEEEQATSSEKAVV